MQLLSTGLLRMGTVCRRLFLPQRFQDAGWRQRQLVQAYTYGMIHRIGDRGEWESRPVIGQMVSWA